MSNPATPTVVRSMRGEEIQTELRSSATKFSPTTADARAAAERADNEERRGVRDSVTVELHRNTTHPMKLAASANHWQRMSVAAQIVPIQIVCETNPRS
jgi:hypothetical protein